MMKHFFIKQPGKVGCRCSKCNTSLYEDYSSRELHAKKCFYRTASDKLNYKNSYEACSIYYPYRSMFYLCQALHDGLHVRIVTPYIPAENFFPDKSGTMKFATISEVVMRSGHNDYVVLTGDIEYFEKWKKMLLTNNDDPKIHCIQTDFAHEVNKYFVSLYFFSDISELLLRYDNGAFLHNTSTSSDVDISALVDQPSEIYAKENGNPKSEIAATAAIISHEDELLLRVIIKEKNIYHVILLGKNYSYFNDTFRQAAINLIGHKYIEIDQTSLENVLAYEKRYSQSYIRQYLHFEAEGECNILLPLLCEYLGNHAMELVVKSGCTTAALYDQPFLNSAAKAPCSSVKDLYHLPVKIVRKIDKSIFISDRRSTALTFFSRYYRINPNLLHNLPRITLAVYEFLRDFEINNPHPSILRATLVHDLGNTLTKDTIGKVATFLSNNPHITYLDYSIYLIGEVKKGHQFHWIPSNFEVEYNEAVTLLDLKYSDDKNIYYVIDDLKNHLQFRNVTEQSEYQKLSTNFPTDREMFFSEDYCILLPNSPADMHAEGNAMHNCVATYVNSVISQETMIVFLRAKSSPACSLVTIEVKKGKVVQAKAKYNRNVGTREKSFIKYWAKIKGLLIHEYVL